MIRVVAKKRGGGKGRKIIEENKGNGATNINLGGRSGIPHTLQTPGERHEQRVNAGIRSKARPFFSKPDRG